MLNTELEYSLEEPIIYFGNLASNQELTSKINWAVLGMFGELINLFRQSSTKISEGTNKRKNFLMKFIFMQVCDIYLLTHFQIIMLHKKHKMNEKDIKFTNIHR